MSFTPENIAELDLLLLFDLSSSQAGLKIHKSATPAAKAAAHSLFTKGMITRDDGGYLTNLGLIAAEHAQGLFTVLTATVNE
jgi:uncharacterized protein (TIGR02647 family)